MPAAVHFIPFPYLRERLDLDPKSGVLTWRTRLREQFPTELSWIAWNKLRAGKSAGGIHHSGYRMIEISIAGKRHCLQAHRLVFALAHGRWPVAEIDHINGDKLDNRLSNLREATHAENCQNQRNPRLQNKSGYLRVYKPKRGRKWRATIGIKGRQIHLGDFATPEEAHAAYLEAKAKLHPFAQV